MNVLLTAINAKYIHSNLAVHTLKACTAGYGECIQVAEFTINQYSDYILQEIYRKKPDILAFSCYIWNISQVLEVTGDLRQVLPQAKIWLGGPEVSYDAETFLREHAEIDGIMMGEGERSFQALMRYYLEGRGRLEEISGIAFRDSAVREATGKPEAGEMTGEPGSTEITISPGTGEYIPMDEIPFIYEDVAQFDNRIIYYESSRGCPFSCSYCLSSIDKRVRFRSLELVERELGFFLEHRVPQVKFVDRTFNCDHRHAMAIWQYIRDHDNGITNFHFEIEADLLRPEELDLLGGLRPGLVQLEIGVQSCNKQTLEAVCRRTDFEKIAGAVTRLSSNHNIHLHLDLIAGLPYEDYESFGHSFDQVYQLHPQELQLGFLKVLKGSGMGKAAAGYGIHYRKNPVYEVLSTEWLSYDEIIKLKAVEEVLEIYYNSQQFSHTVEALEKQFASPFAMYEALAEFYESQGGSGVSRSRLQRLELLREFARKRDPENMAWYEECLILDLYLRENAKTRPEWAESLSLRASERIAFYRREEAERRCLKSYTDCNWKQMSKMTHLEHFAFQDGGPGEHWILFDYAARDPLTHSARSVLVDI